MLWAIAVFLRIPAHPEMRDRINAMVKKREAFRPFAPAVSAEQAHIWFEMEPGTLLPYMITTVNVREIHRKTLPAITHVNGTARVQTVSATDNPDFHALLKAVGRATGREMVLNTSFNVKGQPIVNTPHEAISTFLNTGIQALFLENNLIKRRGEFRQPWLFCTKGGGGGCARPPAAFLDAPRPIGPALAGGRPPCRRGQ